MKSFTHIATARVIDQFGNLYCLVKRPTCCNSIQSARYVAELAGRQSRDIYNITDNIEFSVMVNVYSVALKSYIYCNKFSYETILALL